MQRYLNQSRQLLSIFIHCVERNKAMKEIRQAAVTVKWQSRKVGGQSRKMGSFQTLCFLMQEGFNVSFLFLFLFSPPFKLPSTLQSSKSLSPHVFIWSHKTLKVSTFFIFLFYFILFLFLFLFFSFKLKRLTQKRLPRFYLVTFFSFSFFL